MTCRSADDSRSASRAARLTGRRTSATASLILSLLACWLWITPAAAWTDGGIQGAQAIAYLNQQRAANGIPPIGQDIQSFAAAWCPNEDAGPSGGEWDRDMSGALDAWSATSSPWDNAPLHQFSIYGPLWTGAGDVNAGGEACMGMGDAAGEASSPTYYAWLSDDGPGSVPATETVEGEGPFAPQQAVGIPQGTATGPQPLLYALGLPGESFNSFPETDPHALSWSLATAAGRPVTGVKFVDDSVSAAYGYPGYIPGGGVMVPPPLTPGVTYDGSVLWQALAGGSFT